MKHRTTLPLAPAALTLAVLLVAGAASGQTAAPTPAATTATSSIGAGSAEVRGLPHGARAGLREQPARAGPARREAARPHDACTTCHGDGVKHMEAGGDASLIHALKGAAGAQDCLTCHEKTPGPHDSFSTGYHSNTATVNCLTCHSVHKSVPKSEHLLAKAPGALCATCHLNQTASFENKPYTHRLNRGGMTCLDCHGPHAARGEPVKMTMQGDLPCLNCHAELRGPFVFQHVSGSGGNCLSCHQNHGSNNPNMLQWARVDQLCLSCHSQTGGPKTYGSQPPSFHDLRSPRYRNCTTCHVAVHGSNVSPQLLK